MLKKKWWVVVWSLLAFSANAQIQITFPVSRIVFQRDNNNEANVNITGSYLQQLDRIDARAFPVVPGQGNEVGWTTIQDYVTTGIFNGHLRLKGGWYHIEVRGVLNNQVVTSTMLERVGVGEVFIVSGQSNAQGDGGYPGGATGASDDRVSTIDFYETALDESRLPFSFSHLGNSKRMAPYNYVPWFWARLGDRLAQKLNVPVLFYGASLGGISVGVWQRSVRGEDMTGSMPTFIKVPGMPYRAMKAALQEYASRTGVRAVLWQQGESDESTPSWQYYQQLRELIEASRNDSGKGDLAWVVARSSRNPAVHPNVIEGQNMTINSVSSVFAGPSTDEIVGTDMRMDGIHFFNEGLNRAADYWNSSLNNAFFSNSNPVQSKGVLKVNVSCNPSSANNKFTLQAEGQYSSYSWNTGANGNSIAVNPGNYSLKAKDAHGNSVYSQPIPISANNNVIAPSINVGGATTFCEGDYVMLSSSVGAGNVWSNGEKGQTILARSSGTYSVTNFTINGCAAGSGGVNVHVNAAPFNSIQAMRDLPICPDDSVTLVTNNFGPMSYQWNTGENGQSITVKNAGTYSLKLRDQNGCESTSYINVDHRQRPFTDVIADGPTIFCLGKSVNLSSGGDYSGYIWNTGSTEKTINVRAGGDYFLRVRDGFGCLSMPAARGVTVNPLPEIKINATGLEQFCPGNVVRLEAASDENFQYIWNTGSFERAVTITSPGLFTLRVRDDNGCESNADSIRLQYIPPPALSISTIDNINTICDGQSLTLSSTNAVSYAWNTGATSKDIVVQSEGTYSLKIRDEKNCESNQVSFQLFVKANPPVPTIDKDGVYQLRAEPASVFAGQYFGWKLNETLLPDTTLILKANQQGNFYVQTLWPYPNTNNGSLVCVSPFSQVYYFVLDPNDNGLKVYPNPNPTGIFTIETYKDNPNAHISVYTQGGLLVFSGTMAELKQKQELNLQTLPTGLYILRLNSGDFTASQKLFIKY